MLESIQLIALLIFTITISFVIWGKVDRTIVALIGVILMVVTGVMDEVHAFQFVDWNVIAILIGIWIIAGYFAKTGIPEYLAIKAFKISKRDLAIFVTLLGIISGFVSMFVDNVVVILMFAPMIFHITNKLNLDPFPCIIFVGLCANFMGTALLLGDLPPQMLHSVTGIEFLGFVWFQNKPSSFPILTLTFIPTILFFYTSKFKKAFTKINIESLGDSYIRDKRFAIINISIFIGTIVAMSLREFLGVKLGFIAIAGAVTLILVLEFLKERNLVDCPNFDDVLSSLDWKAIFFYASLFSLVGGLEHVGILEMLAEALKQYFTSTFLGVSILYWVTTPIVGVVEHDAYILTFLYIIKDLAKFGIDPWPYWWALIWSGTLGSNLTMAGAPALYVAMRVYEKNTGRKVSLKEFFSYTVPFTIISSLICYLLLILVWVY
ncbi:MAG: SLC13 family permease [Nitrososphaerales archaeon]|nr:SLC13 family permease [Nitrososphaerales archaeon]